MNKNFVSLEIAEDLNSIGFSFNELCYVGQTTPLYQQVLSWLDSSKKIRIFLKQSPSGMIGFEICRWNYDNNAGIWERIGHMQHYETMEFAYTSAIKMVIELLKPKESTL
jgi:hypothetical protein